MSKELQQILEVIKKNNLDTKFSGGFRVRISHNSHNKTDLAVCFIVLAESEG